MELEEAHLGHARPLALQRPVSPPKWQCTLMCAVLRRPYRLGFGSGARYSHHDPTSHLLTLPRPHPVRQASETGTISVPQAECVAPRDVGKRQLRKMVRAQRPEGEKPEQRRKQRWKKDAEGEDDEVAGAEEVVQVRPRARRQVDEVTEPKRGEPELYIYTCFLARSTRPLSKTG